MTRYDLKGYGSKILSSIKEDFNGKDIVLNIETLDQKAENYEQRLKRFEFYKKNDFKDTGYIIKDNSRPYAILSTAKKFSPEEYKRVFKKMTYGMLNPKLEKAN